ncbi:MAG TPA: DUF1761 domain-containing protein [Novosphingobium sp.]|nr:DUF1761 domain-containing protein [Novosphingobium sp.]
MGPVNWLAVVVAAVVAAALAWPWYGLMRSERAPSALRLAWLIVPAAMIGHTLARVGAATLAIKPWLYWMMSGGFALAIILPAGAALYGRHAIPPREGMVDAGYMLLAFLAMGTVFRLMA